MKISVFTTIIFCLFVVGCAHLHKVQGPQEKGEIPAGIQVGIGSSEVQDGDTVVVQKSTCKKVYRGRAGYMNECSYKSVGEAKVLKVLDHDSAIVEPIGGIAIDERMRVEKED